MIIGLTGRVGAGKDSTADLLIANYPNWVKMGFADPLREMMAVLNPLFNVGHAHYALGNGTAHYNDIVRALGYQRAKGLTVVRKFLQTLGTEAVRDILGKNTWVNALFERLYDRQMKTYSNGAPDQNVAVIDVRFLNEAETIKMLGGYVVRVVRTGNERVNEHVSETEMDSIVPDFTIEASNMDELTFAVHELYKMVQSAEATKEAEQARIRAELFAQHTGSQPSEAKQPQEPAHVGGFERTLDPVTGAPLGPVAPMEYPAPIPHHYDNFPAKTEFTPSEQQKVNTVKQLLENALEAERKNFEDVMEKELFPADEAAKSAL